MKQSKVRSATGPEGKQGRAPGREEGEKREPRGKGRVAAAQRSGWTLGRRCSAAGSVQSMQRADRDTGTVGTEQVATLRCWQDEAVRSDGSL